MSTLVGATELRHADIFETQNGSAYMVASPVEPNGVPRARLWCAHPPDATVFDPPLIDLSTEQEVRFLKADEAEVHYTHEGYVEHVFRGEMDRRHNAKMQAVYEQANRDDAARREQLRVSRPWWKKVFG